MVSVKCGVALLLAVALATASIAEGPFGGSVTSLVIDAKGDAPQWAATTKGLFRYTGGTGWSRIEALGQRQLTAVAAAPGRVLAAEKLGGLWLSEDGGAAWVHLDRALRSRFGHRADDVLCVATDPAEPSHLYLGAAAAGPFESLDGGSSWTLLIEGLETEPPPALHPTAFAPPLGDRPLLMGTDGQGLYRREGGRWTATGAGLPKGLRARGLAADPSDPNHLALATYAHGLWESRDGGDTWRQLARARYGYVGAVAVARGGVVAAHLPGEGIALFRDGKPIRTRTLRGARVLTLSPRGDGGWFVGLDHDGAAELSADGSFVGFLDRGLDATQVFSLASGADEGTVWAGDTNGVFVSVDGGATWAPKDEGLMPAAANVFLRAGGRLFLGSAGQGVYVWDAEKKAWEGRSGGLGTANTIFALVRDADGGRLYVGTEGGILRSDDLGGLWVRKNRGLPGVRVGLVTASLKEPGRLWAAGAGRIFTSGDAGDTWEPLLEASPVALASVLTGDRERVLALEASRLVVISGGRAEGISFPVRPGETLQSLSPVGGRVWVGSSRSLWLLEGDRPRRVWEGAGVLSVLPVSNGGLLAGTDGRGVVPIRVE